MRINRETLLKIAQDTASQRSHAERNIQSIYLCGSLLGEDVLLGGTADIDLVFVHIEQPEIGREIVRLTEDVHLDISHHWEKDYRQTRQLRMHPWLGPTIVECKILYDPHHFMDFTLASVRGQFYRSEYVLARARSQAEHARQMWMAFQDRTEADDGQRLAKYLKAVEHAANALASLTGIPLTERRFLIYFKEKAEKAGYPGLYAGLLGLLGGPQANASQIQQWLPAWQEAMETAATGIQSGRLYRLNSIRLPYYRRAFETILKSDQPVDVLWPLLRTWTDAVLALPTNPAVLPQWNETCQHLKLMGENFNERLAGLDAFLDMVEEALDNWARENGAA